LKAFDPDGDSLTILIWEGDSYTAQGNRIIPDKGFTGILEVPIQVTDGIALSSKLRVKVSVFEKVIDFYKGQIISSETYEVSIGPNPLPSNANEVRFRSTLPNSDMMRITIYDELANIIHRGEAEPFHDKYYYTWKLNFDPRLRGRAYLVLLEYYLDGMVIRRDKKMIGVKR